MSSVQGQKHEKNFIFMFLIFLHFMASEIACHTFELLGIG